MIRSFAVSLFVFGLALALPAAGHAQDAVSPAKPKDAQAAYEPRTEPGVGQEFLKRFVGDWEVVKTIYPRSGGAPNVTKGECHQFMIHKGRYLQSDFIFHEKDGSDTDGTGITGFDPKANKFTSTWQDSRSVKMSIRQSREPFNGTEVILWAESLGKEPVKLDSRTVAHLEQNDKKLIHRAYTIAPDGKEQIFMELALTRKPAKSK